MSNSAEVRDHVESTRDRDEAGDANAAGAGDTADIVRHLAHELRQPLSTIESIAYYLDLILPPDASKARQQVEKLQHLVEQSNWIVSNAVDFAQAAPLSPERIDLGDLVASAVALCDEPGPRVEFENDGALLAVTVDRIQGEHLLRNLFTYFWDAGTGGPVAFRANAAHAHGHVVIDASAQAEGYSQQKLDLLFEPFNPNLPAGAGLSMASMRRIVAAHGGWIRARAGENRISIQIALPE
jgi:nitrogen fixation/metabolism regulation signal transduction histidine kinase